MAKAKKEVKEKRFEIKEGDKFFKQIETLGKNGAVKVGHYGFNEVKNPEPGARDFSRFWLQSTRPNGNNVTTWIEAENVDQLERFLKKILKEFRAFKKEMV